MKISIIGMGNMGSAIGAALEGKFEVNGCDRGDNVARCVEGADAVVLAVKPQDFETMAGEVDVKDKLVISIMAGVSVGKIGEAMLCKKIVRVMPNLPLKYGKAVSGWFCSEAVEEEEKAVVREILKSFGKEIEVTEEDKINKITALSGSGPAYYYFLNRCMRMKALEMGFSEEEAREIASGTFLGAAELLEKSGECSGKLMERITSKGGTTEAALNCLEEKNVEAAFGEAIEKAYKRAKELNE